MWTEEDHRGVACPRVLTQGQSLPVSPSMQQNPQPQCQQRGDEAKLGEMMTMLRELLNRAHVGDGRPSF